MFSKKNKNACPICTEDMNAQNGRLVCPSCGYSIAAHDYAKADCNCFTSDTPTLHQDHAKPAAPVQSRPTQTSSIPNKAVQSRPAQAKMVQNKPTAQKAAQASAGQSKQQKTKKRSKGKAVISFTVVLAVISRLLPALVNTIDFSNHSFPGPSIPEVFSFDYSELADNTDKLMENIEENQKAMEALQDIPAFYLPQSDMFRHLLTVVYQKDYQQITKEELEAFTSLELAYDEHYYRTISYSLANGETGMIYYDDVSVATSDFSCFKGLESLYLEGCTLEEGDLDGLDKLTALRCEDLSLSELAEIIDPQQLTSLTFECGIFSSSLSQIELFSNLTSLSVEGYYSLSDISGIEKLPNLKKLEIIDGDEITSFSVLYEMPWLTSLSIDSSTLRDIGFVANMQNLEELSISRSELMDISVLENCTDTLTKLYLIDNYYLENYDIVSECTRLTDLGLAISYRFDEAAVLPELGNMPQLTKLYMSGYDDMSKLADAKGLVELTLKYFYGSDYSYLTELTSLKRLTMLDLSCEPSEIEPIRSLTQLEELYLEDCFIWGNAEWFLSLPSLKTFYVDTYSTLGFDVTNLELNESLEVLTINGPSLRALVNGKWDYQAYNENEISLNNFTYIFENYPNLRELHLQENTLSDISFAKALTKLQILDITDNYVTSLAPLQELTELHSVICRTNPIADEAGLEDILITEN